MNKSRKDFPAGPAGWLLFCQYKQAKLLQRAEKAAKLAQLWDAASRSPERDAREDMAVSRLEQRLAYLKAQKATRAAAEKSKPAPVAKTA